MRAEEGRIDLVWSFMHEDETILCPFPERQLAAWRLSTLCHCRVGPKEEIISLAQTFQQQASLTGKDALHLACACSARADFFLSCDDRLIKQAGRLDLKMKLANPLDFVRMENFND